MIKESFSIEKYLKNGSFDEHGRPKREIYLDWAETISEDLEKEGMTKASLRRFYSQVKVLQPLLQENFDDNKHKLYRVLTLATYGVNRDQDVKLPDMFLYFIRQNIELATKDLKHYLAFLDHFESVVAYFKGK